MLKKILLSKLNKEITRNWFIFSDFSSFGMYTPSAYLHEWAIFPLLQTLRTLQSQCSYTCRSLHLGMVLSSILLSSPHPPLPLGEAPSGQSLMKALVVLSAHRMDPVVVLWVVLTIGGLEVVIYGILGAGEAASPLLTKELLGQIKWIGQECSPLPGSLLLLPPVEFCPA